MIGKLDQRITLQRHTLVSDGLGGSTKTWGAVPAPSSVWARVQPKGGSEAMQADRQNATQLFLFTIRNREDLTEADRIVWREDAYNIRRIESVGGRGLYLVIEGERGVAD